MMGPDPGQVVVWWMAIDEVATRPRWMAVLDAEERAKAARFRFDADRRQYVAGHALVRMMLASFRGVAAADLRFDRDRLGRPELDDGRGLRFSLSHTRRLVACAVAAGDAVGLDVEADDPARPVDDLARSFFTPAEADLVAVGGGDAFLRLWTLKEAFVKATGEGLARPLDSFAFSLDPIRVDDHSGAADGWGFAQIRPRPDHVLSVALRRAEAAGIRLDATEIQSDDL